MQKSIEKVMHLEIDFWKNGGFGEEKWRHVGTKIDQKSMPTWKSDFLKKHCFSLEKTMILRVQGVEVGGKNRCKIDKNMESRWEDILGSIFSGFWWIFGGKLGGKMEPRSTQEGIEKAMEKWKALRWPQDANRTF